MEFGSFIAVFDSGVGGISVLKEMVRLMPYEDFVYFGDSANAPYGTKSTLAVRRLTTGHIEHMMDRGAKAACIACNTATSAAVRSLRDKYPDFPLVGIEPALKPAADCVPGGRILVMATPMTIREEKFHNLLARYEDMAVIIPLACPGLMEFVEDGKADTPEAAEFLHGLLREYEGNVDAVVLGCTHYPFVRRQIAEVLGADVQIFDGSAGTARELRRRIVAAGIAEPNVTKRGKVIFENSAGDEKIALCERLMGQ
ncbi:MAG: glutamate racemase [Lachnospiraceae bacterium]|nr:glutamate racemase [Lachnospiraceae bacterium]